MIQHNGEGKGHWEHFDQPVKRQWAERFRAFMKTTRGRFSNVSGSVVEYLVRGDLALVPFQRKIRTSVRINSIG